MHLVKISILFTEFNYVSEVHKITKKDGPHYDGENMLNAFENSRGPSARRMWPAGWSSLFYAKYSS